MHMVYSASFSTDGTRIVTASWDTTAKVWDARALDREFLPRELAPAPREVKRP
jgi:WD40 repeat protein